LRQVRHFELAGLLSACLLGPWIDGAWARLRRTPRFDAERVRSVSAGAVCALVAGASALWGGPPYARLRATRSPAEWIDGGPVFLRALSLVPDGSNLYVPFARAGLAIWYGFPRRIRVFYDPRNDCYSEGTYRAFSVLLDPMVSRERIRDVLERTHTTAALAADGQPITWALDRRAEWHRFTAARPLALFVKSS
jgi:hypothetical protein